METQDVILRKKADWAEKDDNDEKIRTASKKEVEKLIASRTEAYIENAKVTEKEIVGKNAYYTIKVSFNRVSRRSSY